MKNIIFLLLGVTLILATGCLSTDGDADDGYIAASDQPSVAGMNGYGRNASLMEESVSKLAGILAKYDGYGDDTDIGDTDYSNESSSACDELFELCEEDMSYDFCTTYIGAMSESQCESALVEYDAF